MDKNCVDFVLLKEFMTKVFVRYGVPEADAEVCVQVLLDADRQGIESHGVNRFKPIYLDRIKAGILNPVTNYETVRETPTTAVVDGHDGMGMVIATRAMNTAIDKAKKFGMGMTAVRNSSHYGIAGHYADMAAKRGCVGITGTNARPSIAPTFGVQNMLGTNPLCFALPSDEPFNFVLDCATSITQRGKIEYYAKINKPVPDGQVVFRRGKKTTDAEAILTALTDGTAALAPLGGAGELMAGYKGYGYATVVEVLSAAFAQGQYLTMLSGLDEAGRKKPISLGHFFIAIDCEAFAGEQQFRRTTGEILRELRASEKAPDSARIYTAGEKEYEISEKRKKAGVPLTPATQKEFLALRDDLKLDIRFPFE